nr:MAG TPA: hypothetical protein [Caudoviricetes sp.]
MVYIACPLSSLWSQIFPRRNFLGIDSYFRGPMELLKRCTYL